GSIPVEEPPPPPPLKLLPSFRVDCLHDVASNQGVIVTEESNHGIRVSLFRGRNPATPVEVEPEVVDTKKGGSKKGSVAADVVPVVVEAPPPPQLVAVVVPMTQSNVVEWVVETEAGVCTFPSLQLPAEATPGEYFLQFDSTIDHGAIPSAYYGFTILRADETGEKPGKKDPKKK
ncbi:hypothetical protein As57867_003082, partial [Aphanomyces stellatus]